MSAGVGAGASACAGPEFEFGAAYKYYNPTPFYAPYATITHSSDNTEGGYVLESVPGGGVVLVRGVKRRNTANKKERRRTQSINAAFHDLRDRIPNVPPDTKLSKIKTLRLATSYISYLLAVLESGQPMPLAGFRADLAARRRPPSPGDMDMRHITDTLTCRKQESDSVVTTSGQRPKGRTGWPQHVWALELKQEQNL